MIPRRMLDFWDDIFEEGYVTNKYYTMMKTDIKDTEENYELIIDMPGIKRENIKIYMENGYLIIEGNCKEDGNNNSEKFIRKERCCGTIMRKYYLGSRVAEDKVKATIKDGVLTVLIPKKENIDDVQKKYIDIG